MDYFDKLFYDMKEETVIGEMQLLKRCAYAFKKSRTLSLKGAKARIQPHHQASVWLARKLFASAGSSQPQLCASTSLGVSQRLVSIQAICIKLKA